MPLHRTKTCFILVAHQVFDYLAEFFVVGLFCFVEQRLQCGQNFILQAKAQFIIARIVQRGDLVAVTVIPQKAVERIHRVIGALGIISDG